MIIYQPIRFLILKKGGDGCVEKDYFDDRSYQAIFNCLIELGDIAWICTKEKQPIAKTIDDLDKIIIVRKLTSVKKHPRTVGLKLWDLNYLETVFQHKKKLT